MKISKVDVFRTQLKSGRAFIFCRVYTDVGIYGDGEVATIHTGYSTLGMIRDFAKQIIGKNPMKNELIWEDLYKTTFFGQNGGPVVFAGISALDIAIWDIKGKALGLPVHELLGGKTRDEVRVYASQLQNGWWPMKDGYHPAKRCTEIEHYRQCAEQAKKEGFDAVKVDFFAWTNEGIRYARDERERIIKQSHIKDIDERMSVTREALGPDIELIVENHSRIDMLGAIQVAKLAEKYGPIMYFEEPNTPNPWTASYLQTRINIPIAAGERIYTRWQYIPYFENRSIQVIQPDLCNCGGYTEVKKICDMAHAYDIPVQLHACGSPLSTQIALQLEAVIPNFVIHEHHTLLRSIDAQICKYNIQPENGKFKVPDEPGIGNELTQEAFNLATDFYTVQ